MCLSQTPQQIGVMTWTQTAREGHETRVAAGQCSQLTKMELAALLGKPVPLSCVSCKTLPAGISHRGWTIRQPFTKPSRDFSSLPALMSSKSESVRLETIHEVDYCAEQIVLAQERSMTWHDTEKPGCF